MNQFSNLIELTRYFKDEQTCRDYLEQLRWNGSPACPFCGTTKVYKFADKKRWNCGEKECRKRFTVTVGTIYESSKIPLQKWFAAQYIITSHKKGISSIQLSKDITVTQKSAWFMLHRIREAMKEKAPEKLEGIVEADETYIGAQRKNLHKWKRDELNAKYGSSTLGEKAAVVAIVKRNGGVRLFHVPDLKRENILPQIKANLKEGSILNTDKSHLYTPLGKDYTHQIINHEAGEYVRGQIHTNTVEGFFSLLKRQIYGIHHFVSKKHLQRYCNEMGFRYERREQGEAERFDNSIRQCETRLKYNQLIGK